jgi:phage gpG-like protein
MTDPKFEIIGIPQVVAALRTRSTAIVAALTAAVSRATIDLTRFVKEQKLSGQVLGVRTGRLRRSVNQSVTDEHGVITGIVGTNVSYGVAWELGFKGRVPVRAFERTVMGQRIPVRAHTRQVTMVARPFLAPSLAERYAAYQLNFQRAVQDGSRVIGT